MELEALKTPEYLELRATGRLDGQWAGELESRIAASIREGVRDLRLDLSGIVFMSSAGIRALLRSYRELKAIRGSLVILKASDQVEQVLAMSGLLSALSGARSTEAVPQATDTAPKPAASTAIDSGPSRTAAASPETGQRPANTDTTEEYRTIEGGTAYSTPPLSLPPVALTLQGDPERFQTLSFGEADLRAIEATEHTVALGLGAFGSGFAECSGYFGEFLVAGGAAVCIPATPEAVPDYMLARGDFVPTVRSLYAIVCEGAFSSFFQFEAEDRAKPLGLAAIVHAAVSRRSPMPREAAPAGNPAAPSAFMMLAETAGLVGVRLTASPVAAAAGTAAPSPWDFPDIRDRFSLTSEPAWPRSLALVVGIVAGEGDSALSAFARPFGLPGRIGHFHAAALSYRALPAGRLEPAIVRELLESQSLLGMLHLLSDDRPFAGIGESRFLRGAVWVGEARLTAPGQGSGRIIQTRTTGRAGGAA